jgi:hypothetical protein
VDHENAGASRARELTDEVAEGAKQWVMSFAGQAGAAVHTMGQADREASRRRHEDKPRPP